MRLKTAWSIYDVLLSGIAATVPTGIAQAACTLGAVAVLPLHIQGGHFGFTAEINKRPANFILDTGAFTVVLTKSAAERLGVRLSATDITSYGVGGTTRTYRGFAKQMQIGNINADGQPVAASDMQALADSSGFDGLFGMNLMAAYDVDLDVAGQHAIIYQAEGNCRSPTVALAQPLYDVPLVYITNDRQAEVDINVNGRPMRAVVDSGAASTVMFRKSAARLGVDLSGFSAPGHHAGHGIGPFAVRSFTHVFDVVQIGNLEFHHKPVEIIDQAGLGINHIHIGSLLPDNSDGEGGGEDMLLGADFMRQVHVWISHSSHRLIMQYPPQPSVLPR